MMKEKIKIILFIIGLICIFLLLVLMLFTGRLNNQTEENTTEYSATISDVQVNWNVTTPYVQVNLSEYKPCFLLNLGDDELVQSEDALKLKSGDKISFRVSNFGEDNFEKADFVTIVSLKTEEGVLFSIDDYNAYTGKGLLPGRICGFVIIILLNFLSVRFVLRRNDSVKVKNITS